MDFDVIFYCLTHCFEGGYHEDVVTTLRAFYVPPFLVVVVWLGYDFLIHFFYVGLKCFFYEYFSHLPFPNLVSYISNGDKCYKTLHIMPIYPSTLNPPKNSKKQT